MTVTTQSFAELLGNVFDIRDVIARFEELEGERELNSTGDSGAFIAPLQAAWDRTADGEEYAQIKSFLDDVRGLSYGGYEQWRGDWYPVTFIADSYFTEYARELAEDIGAVGGNEQWPCNCIDWTEAARQLQQDYSSVEIDGAIYWYR